MRSILILRRRLRCPQARGVLAAASTRRGRIGLADVADQFPRRLYQTCWQSANSLGIVAVTTGTPTECVRQGADPAQGRARQRERADDTAWGRRARGSTVDCAAISASIDASRPATRRAAMIPATIRPRLRLPRLQVRTTPVSRRRDTRQSPARTWDLVPGQINNTRPTGRSSAFETRQGLQLVRAKLVRPDLDRDLSRLANRNPLQPPAGSHLSRTLKLHRTHSHPSSDGVRTAHRRPAGTSVEPANGHSSRIRSGVSRSSTLDINSTFSGAKTFTSVRREPPALSSGSGATRRDLDRRSASSDRCRLRALRAEGRHAADRLSPHGDGPIKAIHRPRTAYDYH